MLFTSNAIKTNAPSLWVKDLLSLVLVLGLFYALWIGAHPLFTPDEGRYSEVAREMVASGDYVTPRLNGVAFLDKPALYYWLQASAIRWFGLKEWALRFWPASLGILGALVTYMAGRLLFDRRTGIVSAIIVASSPLYYGAAHYANLDLEVASLIGSSLLCFITAVQQPVSRLKTALFIAAYVFAGLAALTKGLIGIAFPGMIIGSWIILLNRWSLLLNMRLILGLVLFIGIAAPWYYLVQKANPEFLHFFFVTQQVSRFLTTQDFNDKAAIWFYIPVVLVGFFPWSVYLVQALAQKIKAVWQDKQAHAVDLYLILWFFIVFVFFSIPRSKTVGYILPIFPVSALIVGSYLSRLWDAPKAKGLLAGTYLFIALCLALGLGFVAVPLYVSKIDISLPLIPCLRYMSYCLFAMIGVSLVLYKRRTMMPLFAGLSVSITVLLLIFISSAAALNEKSIKPLVAVLKPQLTENDEVMTFYKYYQDLPIYLERRITIVADWHASDIASNDNWLREMWYGMVFQDTKDWLIEDDVFWKRWKSAKRVFVITDSGHFRRLEKKTTVYKLAEHHEVVLFSNQPNRAG